MLDGLKGIADERETVPEPPTEGLARILKLEMSICSGEIGANDAACVAECRNKYLGKGIIKPEDLIEYIHLKGYKIRPEKDVDYGIISGSVLSHICAHIRERIYLDLRSCKFPTLFAIASYISDCVIDNSSSESVLFDAGILGQIGNLTIANSEGKALLEICAHTPKMLVIANCDYDYITTSLTDKTEGDCLIIANTQYGVLNPDPHHYNKSLGRQRTAYKMGVMINFHRKPKPIYFNAIEENNTGSQRISIEAYYTKEGNYIPINDQKMLRQIGELGLQMKGKNGMEIVELADQIEGIMREKYA